MSAVGAAIEALRTAAGYSRPELAVKAGITRAYLGKVEKGAAEPSARTMSAVAGALGMSVAELMTRAAVVAASTADASDERGQRLVRAAMAVAPLALSRPAVQLGGLAVGALREALAAREARRAGPEVAVHTPRSVTEVRNQLHALIDTLPDDEVVALQDLLRPAGSTTVPPPLAP